MSSKKYANDYRLENVKNKKGKIVTKPIYRGDIYYFEREESVVSKRKITILVFTILEVIIFISALFLNSASGRVVYILLPYLLVAFPLLGQIDGVYTLFNIKSGCTRAEKDKVESKLVSYFFLTMIFSFSSVLGHIVHAFISGEDVVDLFYLFLTLIIGALSLSAFLFRKDLKMEKGGSASGEKN